MRKSMPTGVSVRVNSVTGRRQYRARIQDPSASRLPSGKTKQISSKWFDSRREAIAWLESQRHTKRTVGTLDFNRSVTVEEACDTWMEAARTVGIDGRKPVEPTTEAQYAFIVRRYVKPSIGLIRVAELTKPKIIKWRDNQVSTIGRDAAKRSLGVLRQVLAYQATIGNIPLNPAVEVKLAAAAGKRRQGPCVDEDAPDEKPVDDYMAPEDVMVLLATADTIAATGRLKSDAHAGKPLSPGNQRKRLVAWQRYRCLVYVLVASGMRIGEACALQWRHIDFEQSAIRIEQAYKRTPKGEKKIGLPKTSRSRRVITMGVDVMGLLRGLQASDNSLTAQHFVFGGATPPSPTNIRNRCWVTLVQEAGLVTADGGLRWRIHDCRHYHASALINANKPLPQVSERLGHANTVVTQTVYSHIFSRLKGLGNTIGSEMEGILLGKA